MMGPWAGSWYEGNNIPSTVTKHYSEFLGKEIEIKKYSRYYAGGRIDIRGVPDEPYGLEYGLPIMESNSWNLLSEWLLGLETERVLYYTEIINKFEQETGHKIVWFKEKNK